MPRYRSPQPRERWAREYRRAHERWDREPGRRLERAGFGYGDGYHGAYAERPGYYAPYSELHPPEPQGSGWPYPLYEVPPDAEERHLRAMADRDLARSVDFAIQNAIGRRNATRIAVYADDAVITVEGTVRHPEAARRALEAAREIPGVRRLRNALFVQGR